MSSHAPLSLDRLLIVQPYVPAYRQPLFAAMKAGLSEHGIKLMVATAHAAGADGTRGDDTTASSADIVLAERRMPFGSKTLIFRHVKAVIEAYRPGLVVVEQAIKNLESWPLLLARSGPSVAMWGQGRSYSTAQSRVAANTKQWLTKRSDWFFSYTQQGAAFVIEHGYPAAHTTVLRNSTDTATLRREMSHVTPDEIEIFRLKHSLLDGRTALFLGGVDERKGISFLLSAAERIAQDLPGFRLLIGGSGGMLNEVRRRQASGMPIVALGRIDGHERALALSVASVIMIPEWVGLVAVDALTTGKPVMTTHHSSHSPEVAYLIDGRTAIFSAHRVEAYAADVVKVLRDRETLIRMSALCQRDSLGLSIESMAQNFVSGILRWREAQITRFPNG